MDRLSGWHTLPPQSALDIAAVIRPSGSFTNRLHRLRRDWISKGWPPLKQENHILTWRAMRSRRCHVSTLKASVTRKAIVKSDLNVVVMISPMRCEARTDGKGRFDIRVFPPQ